MGSSNHVTADDSFQSRILEDVSRSFAFTIPQLPQALAKSVSNAYLICRIVDTVEDEATLELSQKQEFFEAFIHVLHGAMPAQVFAERVAPMLSDRTSPAEHELIRNTPAVMNIFSELNEAQQTEIRHCAQTMSHGMMDFQKKQNPGGLDTLEQMNDYCYYVAGVVGEMLTGLFCDYSEDIADKRPRLMSLAASFGQGLQMTNIIKDIWEDKERGACWFPKDVFREADCDLVTVQPGDNDPRFHTGLQTLIGITHGHLENALSYTQCLPRQETGIRKFCFWAVGMAVGTLQKIYTTPAYTCARDVTLSRPATRRIVVASKASIRSNLMLKVLFQTLARGLPLPKTPVQASPPATVPGRS